MKRAQLVIILSGLAAGLAAGQALAASRSFSLPASTFHIGGGANQSTTVSLPNAGTPGFAVNFTLPRDYRPDSTVRVFLNAMQPIDPNCAAKLSLDGEMRLRNGAPVPFASVPPYPGLTLANNGTLSFPGPFVGVRQTVIVKPINVGQYQRLMPGETIVFSIKRDADDGADTCSNTISFISATVKYTVN